MFWVTNASPWKVPLWGTFNFVFFYIFILFEFLGNKPVTFIKSPQRDIRNKVVIKDSGLVKVAEDYMGIWVN